MYNLISCHNNPAGFQTVQFAGPYETHGDAHEEMQFLYEQKVNQVMYLFYDFHKNPEHIRGVNASIDEWGAEIAIEPFGLRWVWRIADSDEGNSVTF